MKRTVVVITDFSACAEHAARFAMTLAARAGADILLYHAFYVLPSFNSETGIFPYYQDYDALSRDALGKLRSLAESLRSWYDRHYQSFPGAITASTGPGDIALNVKDLLKHKKAWLLVMGCSPGGSAFHKLMYGNHTHAVIRNASCPVLLIPERVRMRTVKTIAFATNFAASERRSLRFTADFAAVWGASIAFLHVAQGDGRKHDEDFRKLVRGFDLNHPVLTEVTSDNTTETLQAYAKKENAAILAMTHRKRSLIGQLLYRSFTGEVIDDDALPVLALPG